MQRAEAADAACARHVTAYDEVARRVAEVEAKLGQAQREEQRLRDTLHAIATLSGYEWSETRAQLQEIIDHQVGTALAALRPTEESR